MAHRVSRVPLHAGRGRGYAHRVSSALRAWLGQPSPRMVDVAVTVAVGVPVAGHHARERGRAGPGPAGLVFGLAATLPLLVRRRWPFAVLAVTLAASRSPRRWTASTCSRSWWRSTRSARPARGRRRSPPPPRRVAAGVVYILAGGPEFTYRRPARRRPHVRGQRRASGCSCRAGATSFEALQERAERLDRERELLAERAVAEERVRIAQELHDVVAHNVSLIVVQAQALAATVPGERVAAATARHRQARPRGDGGDAPHAQAAARRRGPGGRARAAAGAGRPRRPARALARGRPAGRPRRRGRRRGRSPRASTCRRSGSCRRR